jgi:hypothetical protein
MVRRIARQHGHRQRCDKRQVRLTTRTGTPARVDVKGKIGWEKKYVYKYVRVIYITLSELPGTWM